MRMMAHFSANRVTDQADGGLRKVSGSNTCKFLAEDLLP